MAVALWVSLTGAAAYLFYFDPGHTGFFPVCPFRALTGFTCPGCGTTRGLHQLLHGNVQTAFEFNPLLAITLPVLAYLLFLFTKAVLTGRPMPSLVLPRKYGWLVTALVLSFWVLRNTPVYPFRS